MKIKDRISKEVRFSFIAILAAMFTGVLWILTRKRNDVHDLGSPTSDQEDSNTDPAPVTTYFFDYESYATDHRNFQTWVDVIVNRLGLSTALAAFIFSAVVYLGGLLIANSIDFQKAYLRSTPIYIGVFGIFWVFIFIRFSSVRFHKAYEELRPCFLIDDEAYKAHITYWFGKFTNVRGNILFILTLTLIAWVAVYISYFHFDLLKDLNIPSLRPALLRNEKWYTSEYAWVKAFIIGYYGVFVALLLGTAIRLLVINFAFLLSFRNFSVIPLANVIRTRLQSITTIYLVITLSWFVGVALFGIVLFSDLDPFSVLGLLGLSFLGLLTFSTPQIIYRLLLVRGRQMSSKWILASLFDRFHIYLLERGNNSFMPMDIGIELASMDDLSGFVEASAQEQLWVYNPGDMLLIIIAQLVALASVFAEDFFRNVFS